MASLMPNMAYVVDTPKPGITQKAGFRDIGFASGVAQISTSSYQRPARDWGSLLPGPPSPLGSHFGAAVIPDPKHDGFKGFGGCGDTYLTMGAYRSKALSAVQPHEELEPLENNHPLRQRLVNPNPMDTFFDLFYEQVMFGELCGVDYLWTPMNRWGKPAEMYVLPSHWVWPRTGGGKYANPENPHADELIQWYEVRPWGGMGSAGILRIPPNEIIRTSWKSPINKIDGYSKLWAIAQWIDTEESIAKSRWSQMINQARPEFWVELGPGYDDPNDDRIARMEAKFGAKFQGEYNYGKPIFTPSGAKVTPLSFSPAEMAYFASEEQVRDTILATWRVPQAAVGLVKEMTYGSVLATLMAFCSNCLNPRLAQRGEVLTKHLARHWDEETPSWSSNTGQDGGHAGHASSRKVRIWWDDCLDEETECLTSAGWKRHHELTDATKIACYDEVTNTLIYRTPSRIVRRHHDGDLHLWEGGRVNAAMTPNHRVYVQRRRSDRVGEWKFKLASDLGPTGPGHYVKRAAPAACDVPIAVDLDRYTNYHQQKFDRTESIDPRLWLEFLGYFLSEGCLWRNKNGRSGSWLICIVQTIANRGFSAMQECIQAMPGNWKQYNKTDKRVTSSPCVHFRCTDRGLYEHLLHHCGRGAANKKVPDYVKAWPAADLRVLLDALIAGDGRRPKVNSNTGVWNSQYTTTSKQLADDVMEVAIKCGIAASITPRLKEKEHYTVNLSSRTKALILPENCRVTPFSGTVWCVTVPTGKFVVRRNGVAHITGNCAPADPQQVNSDLMEDRNNYAITPNEVRALRGRKAYRFGGDDPIVQGPGGVMPFPMNTQEDLSWLAEKIAPMTQSQGQASEESVDPSTGKLLGEQLGGEENGKPANNLPVDGEAEEIEGQETPKIENPNGKPQKFLMHRKGFYDLYKIVYQTEPGNMIRPLIFGLYPKGPAARLTMSNNPSWEGPPCDNKAEAKQEAENQARDMGWKLKGVSLKSWCIRKKLKPPDEVDEELLREVEAIVPAVMPEVVPQQLGVIRGLKIVVVDGDWVKQEYSMDFVEAGNGQRYDYIPEDEIWVDCNIALHDWVPNLYHELTEVPLMAAGEDYEQAHRTANVGENLARAEMHPINRLKLLTNGVKKNGYFEECDRDDKGRCLPSGQGGSNSSKKPAGGTATAVKPETADRAAPAAVRALAKKLASRKVGQAPVPDKVAVAKAQRELKLAKQGKARPGGENRGGSAAARRKQRENLFNEFGGGERGYVPCPHCGVKMHHSPPEGSGMLRLERGKIFTKCQGGGYQLANLLPECFGCNRSRNAKPIRKENPC